MPPHTVFEWIVGQNLPKGYKKQPARRQSYRIELSTDDETDTDSITVVYPRNKPSKNRKKHKKSTTPDPPEGKRVTFRDKPLKSALKKPRAQPSSETSSEGSSEASSEDSSTEESGAESDDESSEEERKPKPKPKSKPKRTRKKAKKPNPPR